MVKLWVSCPMATGQVNIGWSTGGTIVFTPPVWRIFMGQPLINLTRWLQFKFGPVAVEEL